MKVHAVFCWSGAGIGSGQWETLEVEIPDETKDDTDSLNEAILKAVEDTPWKHMPSRVFFDGYVV